MATISGTNKSVYINGALDNSGSGTAISSAAVPLTIGSKQNGSGIFFEYFNGSIDDVRIYNRALSAAQVAQLYNPDTTLNAPQTKKVTTGLVGLWTFNNPDMNWATGQAIDRSGQGNNGQLINMSTTSSPTIGKNGQALKFNGTNQYVQMGNVLNPGTSNFSFGGWFRSSSSGNQTIVSKSLFGAQNFRWYFDLNDTSGSGKPITCMLEPNGGSVYATSTTSYNDGKWHHAMCVVNRTGSLSLYVDGTLKDSFDISSVSGNSIGTTDCLELGAYADNTGACSNNLPFNGIIDEVRIYNTALTAAQVMQLYNAGK